MSQTISAIRTITISKFDTQTDPFEWPDAQITEDLDYGVDVSFWLNDVSDDALATAQVMVAPSGSGELQILDLSVIGGIIAIRFSGGVAGRLYLAQLQFVTIRGRKWTMLVSVVINSTLAPNYIPPPPSYAFGTPAMWSNGLTSFGAAFGNVASNITATGNSQGSAFLLQAVVNIITGGIVNTGVILPIGVTGTITIQNDTDMDKFLWPNVGSHLFAGGLDVGLNMAMIISPGQRLNASTSDPTIKWDVA